MMDIEDTEYYINNEMQWMHQQEQQQQLKEHLEVLRPYLSPSTYAQVEKELGL
jgi:hypothetical protein